MDSVQKLFLIIVSVIATGFAWWRIWHKSGWWLVKIGYVLLAAIPVAGPIFYLLIDPPDSSGASLPSADLWPGGAKGTKVWPSFEPLIDFLRQLPGVHKGKEK